MLSIVVLILLSFVAAQSKEEGLPQDRIVHGFDISITEVPFQVGIKLNSETYVHCGGSLISEDLVLTAAHCFYKDLKHSSDLFDANNFIVIGGTAYINESSNDSFNTDISSFILHELYKPKSSDLHDIALLKLKDKITKLKPISLPTSTYPVGAEVMVTGWGATENNNEPSLVLKAVNLIIYSVEECRKHNNEFETGMLCADSSAGDKFPNNGDSGGPLVCKSSNTICGITSFKFENNSKIVTFYTDVYEYRGWIIENSDKLHPPRENDNDQHNEL